jgi:hypothetical protein
VGDAGGEASGDGEFLGAAESVLGAGVLLHLIADLVLALAAAEGHLQGAEEGFGANGALEQEDVAEGAAEFAKALTFGGDLAADGEKDEREIGPGLLLLDELAEFGDGAAAEGFLRNDGGAGAEADFNAELIDGGGGVAGNRTPFEQARDKMAVFSCGREDDRTVFVRVGFRVQGRPPAQESLRSTWERR